MSGGGSIGASGWLNALLSFGQGRSDSRALKRQGKIAAEQGYAEEQLVRREARSLAGEQAAAIAEAGISYTGTTLSVMKESELNAEMDALNARYRGLMRRAELRGAARDAKREGYMMAGAQLLTSNSRAREQRSILSNA